MILATPWSCYQTVSNFLNLAFDAPWLGWRILEDQSTARSPTSARTMRLLNTL
uniref:Uncharacterized protein n=1 Tax=Physcomitrium patens TaxID=3218 RepID=A0A2K1II57_PHYPA|nr:hypothetical protein PHYPA_027651 [Physcomitrium patens]